MNAHTHPDPRLSEKLGALSRAPASAGLRPPKRPGGRVRPLAWAAMAAILGGAALPILAGDDPSTALSDLGSNLGGAVRAGLPIPSEASTATGFPSDAEATSPTGTPTPPVLPAPLVTGSGHVVALEQAAVHPRRGGTIVELAADVGDRVEAGQVLLRLDDPEAGFDRRAAELVLARTRLVLAARMLESEEAQASADRMRSLATGGAVNAQKALDADTEARRAANLAEQGAEEVAEAELALERKRQAIAELTIASPIAGIVTARGARLGEAILAQVDARGEAPLFTIANPDRLGIDVDIAETAVATLRPGLRGEAVLDGYPDRPFAVEVARIAPVASAERGTVALRLTPLSPPSGIRPAMAARVSLLIDAVVASNPEGH